MTDRFEIQSHLAYEPEQLPWPQLDDNTLSRLRAAAGVSQATGVCGRFQEGNWI